jgi:ubiquinol-cytochrome c reductase cytochrome b subunit
MFGSQFPGVLAMGGAVFILFLLPWLDKSPVRSIRYKGPLFKTSLTIFVTSFLLLGYLGLKPSNIWGQVGSVDVATLAAQLCTVLYFLFFLSLPIISRLDRTKAEPDRVTS